MKKLQTSLKIRDIDRTTGFTFDIRPTTAVELFVE